MIKKIGNSCLAASVLFVPSHAYGQVPGDTGLTSFGQIATRLCFGMPDQIVAGRLMPNIDRIDGQTTVQLAQAFLSETRIPVSAIFAPQLADDVLKKEEVLRGKPDDTHLNYGQRLTLRMKLIANGDLKLPFDPAQSLRVAIKAFHMGLSDRDQKTLVVDTEYPGIARNPFDAANSTWTLRCPKGDAVTVVEDQFSKPIERPVFAIRKTPEDLGLGGDAGKEAGAFAFGLERTWEEEADGTKKRNTTIKIDGTVGYQLMGKSSPFSSYAFARYNLERARTKPAAALAAGATREDDDTNVLQLGMTFDIFRDAAGQVPLWFTGDAGYILNFVDDSRRVRIRSAVEPGFTGDMGLCRLGSGKFSLKGKLAIRCLVRFESDIGLWTKKGRFTDVVYDDHLAAGGNIDLSAFYWTGAKSKVIASANARYLPVIAGKQPDIWRYDLNLTHRNFFDFGGAVDVGFGYQHGLQVLTLKPERKFTFGVGFLY